MTSLEGWEFYPVDLRKRVTMGRLRPRRGRERIAQHDIETVREGHVETGEESAVAVQRHRDRAVALALLDSHRVRALGDRERDRAEC